MQRILTFFLIILATITCPAQDQRCAACQADRCIVCYDSFLDETGRCRPSTISVDKCLQYASNGVCEFCQHGYTSTAGKCVKITIEDCDEVDESGRCVMCELGVRIQNGVCDPSIKCELPRCDFCTVQNEIEVCSRCEPGWALLNTNGVNSCVKENSN